MENEDYNLRITALKVGDIDFILDAPDPTGKLGVVANIRQTPQGYMVEVWNELKNNVDNLKATHKAHIYIISPPAVTWIRADGLLVDANQAVGEEE